MVRQQIVRVRQLLTLHLVLLAFLTATLAATGSVSVFLPLLVLMVGCSSLLFVDWLEWFALHHVLAYVGMILGTVFALVDYFRASGEGSTSGQLYAIASLLIYPEIVIMLQRKNMRLFEQMAIFLLLEIIVAALLNDNVLFGTLLAPIVVLWVSALLLLARYKALITIAPDMDRPTPRLYEIVLEAWRQARRTPGERPEAMLRVSLSEETSQAPLGLGALLGQAAPLGVASLVFAGLYFYLLPRATLDNVTAFAGSPRTGLSERIILGSIGKLSQDHTPVIRLSLRHSRTGQAYRLHEPPYIRGYVVSRYQRHHRGMSIEAGSSDNRLPSDQLTSLSSLAWPADMQGYDPVVAKFELLSVSGSVIPCIAPMAEGESPSNFISVLPFEYRMINNRSDVFPQQSKTKYSLLTSAFLAGFEKPVMPDSRQVYHQPSSETTEALLARLQTRNQGQYSQESAGWINDLLAEVRQSQPEANSELALAKAVEEYFSSSGKFSYSLSLRTGADAKLNPIEDFVVNQKRGNCEYYAAALTDVLRHLEIPTRIVLGYHPLEYNELGDYFTVRNSDAHAWVEAYFSAAQLQQAGLVSENWGAWGGWLRLDPTPAGQGSNAGNRLQTQSDQVSDLAQTVWRDYFLNSRQRVEDSSLYGPLQASTRETYVQVVEWFRETIKRMQNSQFVGGAINRETWFSWPVALAIMLIGGGLVVVVRWLRLLPRWAPRLAKKLRWIVGAEGVRQNFYRDCLRLLNRAGFVRAKDQTPHEYTQAAGLQLASERQWDSAAADMSVLTAAYYRLRFGGAKSLTPEEVQAVNAALSTVQKQLK